jgi:hypothetical protein
MPADTATAKRYRSDRWHRLDQLLKGLDEYIASRRAAGASWHAITASIARDTARHPDVVPPTVSTLTRWYPEHEPHAAA